MRGNSNEQSNRGFSCGIARLLSLLLAAAAQLAFVASVFGQAPSSHESSHADQMQPIAIVFARELRDVPPPFSLLDVRPPDDGVAGARLAINDNNTTGRFLKQTFTLEVVESRKRRRAGDRSHEASRSGGLPYRRRCQPANGDRACGRVEGSRSR